MNDPRLPRDQAGRNRQIDHIFAEALDLAAADREEFLRKACGDDFDLRREVAALLEASALEDTFLEPCGAASPGLLRSLTIPLEGAKGQTIGRYRILEEIGRGGMGVVYRAERADGQFHQQVALKLLLSSTDPSTLDRFSRERQILANLEHPRIARLIDGGLTDRDQPYLVMEYIDGLPIDQACRQRGLGLRKRINLLTEVCGAVEAAHRQLVVHQDLKPSNILVREDGQVRLLDFGIAKLLEPGDGHQTQTRERFLTPQYASPEQVRGDKITVASDVYQLGLLAFELLTGQRPYELAGLSAAEAERQVCEEMPRRPSSVSREEPHRRPGEEGGSRPDPRKLAGDLDLILLQALHKDPERRYPSVEAFRHDLERYLAGLPISARPDVWTYRLRKFSSRHRWALTAAGVTLATITLLIVAFVIRLAHERDQTHLEAQRAEMEAQQAKERRGEAQEVTEFLVSLFESSAPFDSTLGPSSGTVGPQTTARELLDRGRQRLDGALPDQPHIRARLLQTVGRVYRNLELFEDAETLLKESVELQRKAGGVNRAQLAESLMNVGSVLSQTGREGEAEAYYREGLRLMIAELGTNHPEVARAQRNLANVLDRLGRYAEVETLMDSAIRIFESQENPDELGLAMMLSSLARTRLRVSKPSEAEELFQRALEIRRRTLEPDDYWVGRSLGFLALSYTSQGRHEDAIPLFREGLEIIEARTGPESLRVAWFLENLAIALDLSGRSEEPRGIMARALAIHRKALGGKDSRGSARLLYNLACLKLAQGDAVGAEQDFRKLRPLQEELFDGPRIQSALTINGIGEALAAQGREAEAEPYFRESVETLEALLGPRTSDLALPLLNLGNTLRLRGELAEAESLIRRAYEILQANSSPEADQLSQAREALAELLRARGKEAEAEALLKELPASPEKSEEMPQEP